MKKEIYNYLVKSEKIKSFLEQDFEISDIVLSDGSLDSFNVIDFNLSTKKFIPKKIKKVGLVKSTWNLIKVSLSNDKHFICTPETNILLKTGKYVSLNSVDILKDFPLTRNGFISIKSIESVTLKDKEEIISISLGEIDSNFELSCGIFIRSSNF